MYLGVISSIPIALWLNTILNRLSMFKWFYKTQSHNQVHWYLPVAPASWELRRITEKGSPSA